MSTAAGRLRHLHHQQNPLCCSYLFVEDVADAFDTILHKGKVGQIYNIGTQKERTVMDVARDIAEIFDLPEENITHVRDRAFNDQRCSPLAGCHVQAVLAWARKCSYDCMACGLNLEHG